MHWVFFSLLFSSLVINFLSVFYDVVILFPSSSLFAARFPYESVQCSLHMVECIIESCLYDECNGISMVMLEDVVNKV